MTALEAQAQNMKVWLRRVESEMTLSNALEAINKRFTNITVLSGPLYVAARVLMQREGLKGVEAHKLAMAICVPLAAHFRGDMDEGETYAAALRTLTSLGGAHLDAPVLVATPLGQVPSRPKLWNLMMELSHLRDEDKARHNRPSIGERMAEAVLNTIPTRR